MVFASLGAIRDILCLLVGAEESIVSRVFNWCHWKTVPEVVEHTLFHYTYSEMKTDMDGTTAIMYGDRLTGDRCIRIRIVL